MGGFQSTIQQTVDAIRTPRISSASANNIPPTTSRDNGSPIARTSSAPVNNIVIRSVTPATSTAKELVEIKKAPEPVVSAVADCCDQASTTSAASAASDTSTSAVEPRTPTEHIDIPASLELNTRVEPTVQSVADSASDPVVIPEPVAFVEPIAVFEPDQNTTHIADEKRVSGHTADPVSGPAPITPAKLAEGPLAEPVAEPVAVIESVVILEPVADPTKPILFTIIKEKIDTGLHFGMHHFKRDTFDQSAEAMEESKQKLNEIGLVLRTDAQYGKHVMVHRPRFKTHAEKLEHRRNTWHRWQEMRANTV